MALDIKAAIPHREPFLLLDEIVAVRPDRLIARATLRPDDELWSRIYAGHYPGSPITPGVLLLEMLFQAAAVLVSDTVREENLAGVPVVTRIQAAKFKAMIFPGDTVDLEVSFSERLANAFFLKGVVKKGGRAAVEAQFAVALAPPPGAGK